MLTPPVCLAAYAAASIAEAPMAQVGWQSVRLAIAAYLVPFIFIYKPGILLIGSLGGIIYAIITTFTAIFFFAVALEGTWFRHKLTFFIRLLLCIAAIALLVHYPLVNAFGLMVFVVSSFIFIKQKKNR